jgi:hypothetical protein
MYYPLTCLDDRPSTKDFPLMLAISLFFFFASVTTYSDFLCRVCHRAARVSGKSSSLRIFNSGF